VLNGMGKEKRISDEIIKKVHAAAKELNYKPHRLARSLRTGNTNVLGVIVIDIANNFHSRLSRSIENRAAELGYRVMICSSDENDTKMAEWVDELISNNVEGIIITPTVHARSKLIELKNADYPFVLVDRHFADFETDFVGIDNFKASFDAVDLFIKEGYRDIGIVAFEPLLSVAQQRVEGYKQAILHNGMQINPNLIKTISYSNIQAEVRKNVANLVHDGVRALLFTTNRIGITGLHMLNELKVRIPQDIAVISYDDNDFYPLMTPSISVVSQPVDQIGRKAVELILDRIKQPEREYQNHIVSAEVIKRESI
jgi:LacI family transcriptional regulator